MKTDLQTAIELLTKGEYTCVLCKGDSIFTSTERGVKPLLNWLDNGLAFKDFSAADKVVGKATALLYVLLGVKEVYAPVMSEGAVSVLTENGISVQYDTLAKSIINRAGTGICPMESAVMDISEPQDAVAAIKTRLAALQNGNKQG